MQAGPGNGKNEAIDEADKHNLTKYRQFQKDYVVSIQQKRLKRAKKVPR